MGRSSCTSTPTSLLRVSLPALLVALAGIALGCSDSSTGPDNEDGPIEEEPSWLDSWVMPMDTISPAAPDLSDLSPFGDMVGDARMVGLGEAAYGSRELARLKHRLLRHLVEEQGFRTVVLEAPWGAGNAVNQYVLRGEGSAPDRVYRLRHWPASTSEMVDLVQWMRSFNQGREVSDRVRFAGFDIVGLDAERDSVETYMASVDSMDGVWARMKYSCFWGATKANWPIHDETFRESCVDNLSAVRQKLLNERDRYLSHTSEEAYQRALHATQIILWRERYLWGEEDREHLMTENLKWLLEQQPPEERTVLWAHNGHVTSHRGPDTSSTVGGMLDHAYGADYLRVAMTFYQGSFLAQDPASGQPLEMSVGLPLDDSVEAFLGTATMSPYVLDLRALNKSPSPEADPVREERPMRSIRSTFDPANPGAFYRSLSLANEFHLVVFIRSSTGSSPL
jgi:erythromycin esterase